MASGLQAPAKRPFPPPASAWPWSSLQVAAALLMYLRMPLPGSSSTATRRRLKVSKQSGRSRPAKGRAWSRAPGLRSSKGQVMAVIEKHPFLARSGCAGPLSNHDGKAPPGPHSPWPQSRGMGARHRHRVVIVIENGPATGNWPGWAACGRHRSGWRQFQKGGLVFPQKLRFGPALAPKTPIQVIAALLGSMALSSSRSLTWGTGTKKFCRAYLTTPSTTPFSLGRRTRQKCSLKR
jgi:hypothetical protein